MVARNDAESSPCFVVVSNQELRGSKITTDNNPKIIAGAFGEVYALPETALVGRLFTLHRFR